MYAAFASPEVYEFLEAEGFKYAIRLPSNKVLHDSIAHLLKRPVGRPPKEVRRYYANFSYRAGTLALPDAVEQWSLTTLREKLVKIGAKVVSHGRYVTFQLAEVAVPRSLFQKILSLIDDLRRRPAPA